MGLVILPALIPDIRQTYDAYFAAFKDDLILDVLFPDGVTEEFRNGHTAHTLSYWHQSDVQHTIKCIDSDTGEVVGMALWDVYLKGRTEEERKNPGVPWLEGERKDRAEKIINPLWQKREALCGGHRHVYCHVVAVKPEHQRRGVGTLLAQWGMDIAEAAGLPVYLESSAAAYPLYRKLGFEQVDTVTHKADVTGGADVEVPLMIKMPSSAGMCFDEWKARN